MSLVPPRCAAAAPLPMTAPCRVRTCSNGVTGPERRAWCGRCAGPATARSTRPPPRRCCRAWLVVGRRLMPTPSVADVAYGRRVARRCRSALVRRTRQREVTGRGWSPCTLGRPGARGGAVDGVLPLRSFPPARGRRGHGRNMGELYCGQNFGWGAKVGRRVTGVYVLANPFRSLAPGRVS